MVGEPHYVSLLKKALLGKCKNKIAARSGVPLSTINRWLRGDRDPRYTLILAVLNTCGYELEVKER